MKTQGLIGSVILTPAAQLISGIFFFYEGNNGQGRRGQAGADDGQHLVIADEFVGCEHGFGGISFGIVDHRLERMAVDAAFGVEFIDDHLHALLFRVPQERAGTGNGKYAADLVGFLGPARRRPTRNCQDQGQRSHTPHHSRSRRLHPVLLCTMLHGVKSFALDHLHSIFLEHLYRFVQVVEAEDDHRVVAALLHEGIHVLDIDVGLEEGQQDAM